MQNLYNQDGLYNNIRLVIIWLYRYYIGAKILGNKFDDQPQVLFYILLIINEESFLLLLI